MSKSDTRERVEAAAVRLFATRGYEGTGIRDIARESKLSTATLYHYMGEKQDLLIAIMQRAMTEMTSRLRDALEDVEQPTEELRVCVRTNVVYHGEHQLVARVADHELMALSAPNRRRILALRDGYEQIWGDVLARGIERHEFEIEDPSIFRLGAIQMCVGVATWYSPTGRDSLESIADKFSSLVLNMARAKAAQPTA